MTASTPEPEYVAARRVLLDALEALSEHRDALVLVGAQAVYLRTGDLLPGYQPYTTDGELAVDPERLGPRPGLDEAMRAAGFRLRGESTGAPEPGVWEARGGPDSGGPLVPVDLIVPERVAPPGGRRAARLGGVHGRRAARRASGLEAALVDATPIAVPALGDDRRAPITVAVAGVGALLVAKAHKIADRLGRPDRLNDKDAGDVYRLLAATPPSAMTTVLRRLSDDDRSRDATRAALAAVDALFATPRAPGVEMATRALAGVLPADTVRAVCAAYVDRLLADLGRGDDPATDTPPTGSP